MNLDQRFVGGDVSLQFGEVPVGLRDAGAVMECVDECPADGTDGEAGNDRSERQLEKATDRRRVGMRSSKPRANCVREVARRKDRRESRKQEGNE